jgi:hypothetical protein
MDSLTPETCRYLDSFCTECPEHDSCEPLANDQILSGKVVIKRKQPVPRWLKDASPSVRKSYGY